MQSVTRQLAEFISTHPLSDVPDVLRRNTGRIIADTVASIVSGAGSEVAPGLLRINGLFRHGWLLAPALVEDALAAWLGEPAAL